MLRITTDDVFDIRFVVLRIFVWRTLSATVEFGLCQSPVHKKHELYDHFHLLVEARIGKARGRAAVVSLA